MTEETQIPEEVKINVFAELRGQYLVVKGNRFIQVLFPQDARIEEVIEYLTATKLVLEEALQKQKEEAEKLAKEPEVTIEV